MRRRIQNNTLGSVTITEGSPGQMGTIPTAVIDTINSSEDRRRLEVERQKEYEVKYFTTDSLMPEDFYPIPLVDIIPEDVEYALGRYVSYDSIEQRHRMENEVFEKMIINPDREYMWHRYSLYDYISTTARARLSRVQQNESSLTQGISNVNRYLRDHTDEQILSQISSKKDVSMAWTIYSDGDGKNLVGLPCKVPGTVQMHDGVVLKVAEGKGIRDMFITVDMFELGVFEISILSLFIPLTAYPLDLKQLKDLVAIELVDNIGYRVNSSLSAAKGNVTRAENNIQGWERSIELEKEKLKEYKAQLEQKESVDINIAQIKAAIKETLTHKKVAQCFVDKGGGINVITKPLLYIQNGKENKEKELGAFHLFFDYKSQNIHAFNLTFANYGGWENEDDEDYDYDEDSESDYPYHYHMNIDSGGKICMGENEGDIWRLFNGFQLYFLVDYLIEFLSLEHKDTANPFITAVQFFKHKKELKEKREIPEPIKL